MKNNQVTLLNYLENQTRLKDDLHISYDDLAEWPADQVEAAKRQGCLVQIDDAEGIICRQCPQSCWKDVEIREKDGHNVGVYFCEEEDCAGLIEIGVERLQQWKIVSEKLPVLNEQPPIRITTDEWLSFAEAAEILAVSKPTLTRWADEGKIQSNGKKGRLRKLNKVSVLLQKQAAEDDAVKKDVKELREDARRYGK